MQTATGWHCVDCGHRAEADQQHETCPRCFGSHWSVRAWHTRRPPDPFSSEAPPTRATTAGSLARLPR